MTVNNLDGFRRVVDPFYEGDSPAVRFDWKPRKDCRVFVITSAQNSTPVHKEFWAILNGVCKAYNADLAVKPFRYKNPTSRWVGSQEGVEDWAPEVRPYLVNTRVKLNANCLLLGDLPIQPTASDPLTGFEAIAKDMSAIVGHPKIQTRVIAAPQNKLPKVLMTSGACTVANYSDTKAGRMGEFHHSLSAVLVELQGGIFFARRLHYDEKTKTVTDMARRRIFLADGQSKTAPRAAALICGDLHERFADPRAVQATWGAGGMVEVGEPEHIVYHDSVDGWSVNHHHGRNPFHRIVKGKTGFSAQYELDSFRDFVVSHTRKGSQNVIVSSNHDDFFSKYIVGQDWREDPLNAEWYLETALHMARHARLGKGGVEYPNAFQYWMAKYTLPHTKVLVNDESFLVRNVELGMHGDRGSNGARGSIRNLRRIGVKSVFGHSHTPGEDEGATQVGVMARLRLEYAHGPSSWMNANCFLNDDGKRQLIFIIDGKWHN